MGDLSTLVLDTHRRTTDQPALIAWSERREAARLERERVRVARIHRARALDLAAIESQTRPTKAPAPVRAPKQPAAKKTTRTQNKTLPLLRPCSGPCGRMTRPTSIRLVNAPDTVTRHKGDMCRPCINIGTPRKQRTLTIHAQIDQMVTMYEAGSGARIISAELGIAKSAVQKHLKRAGVQMRPAHEAIAAASRKIDDPAVVEQIRQMLASGASSRHMSDVTGISRATVYRIIERNALR